jgi:leucyl aminopeptidase
MNTPLECFDAGNREDAVPIIALDATSLAGWRDGATEAQRNWVTRADFKGKPGAHCPVPAADGSLACVLAGMDPDGDGFDLGALPALLPPGRYRLQVEWPAARRQQALLGFALGAYRFQRYGEREPSRVSLHLDDGDDAVRLAHLAEAVYLTRDLINTPANDLLPDALESAARELAGRYGAEIRCIVGDDLLREGYPAIHAVGRASACPPRLLDLRHGDPTHPLVTLVGKGVCFDSGGLDIKPASGMRLMKKDMGGAAQVLGLARAIISPATRCAPGTCYPRAGAATSRSTTPTPRDASSSATPSPRPAGNDRACWPISPPSPARRGLPWVPRSQPCSATTTRSPTR